MPTDHRTELAQIKRFDQLIRYLRDEMDWPIESGNFDELTFEYTPEELGIESKHAARIQEIKRLRPLSANQPWGIFFVKFEPKHLPVLALRRILSRVVLKKRASDNHSERRAWAMDDLLFISKYGMGDERRISFAHFCQPSESRDLPTLKVLGWDNQDTALHLDDVAEKLTKKLAWPKDETDAQAWRESWRTAFELRHREVVQTSKDLSVRLAELARALRDRIKKALDIETQRGPLTRLMKAFQEALIHDMDADGFADMYAQTIAYGLLSSRIADPKSKTADDFAAHMRTNPFLRDLMETFLKVGGRRGKTGGPGLDFDELGVSEVVDLLDQANMAAVVRDFGDKNPQEDPVIHFYELFLKEYDAKKRMQRGVFYTPRPVVSYIVRSVDEILRKEFGLEDGLADTATWGEMVKRHKGLNIPEGVSPGDAFVRILDPATGTGTFLVEVIDLIYRTMKAKWEKEAGGALLAKVKERWNEYVPRHLLPRLYGYELLMAPYAIAHLKLGLKLHETGYRFGSEERARIYLTNALEPASDEQMVLKHVFPALAQEAQAVNEVKRGQRFTVVIGNPPYSNYGQLNKIPFILELLEDYKRGLNEKKLNLDDDFIKFIRFAQQIAIHAPIAIVGMITSNTYIDGITHRRMREALSETFKSLQILDLHGSSTKQEVCPDGSKDENVFDIKQGVSIALFTARPFPLKPLVLFGELWGAREKKYQILLGSVDASNQKSRAVVLEAPNFFFVPKDLTNSDEYQRYTSITDAFGAFGSSVKTDRDDLFFDHEHLQLESRMEKFYSPDGLKEPFRSQYRIEDSSSYKLLTRRQRTKYNKIHIVPCLYRPFDRRWLYYSSSLTSRPGNEVMQHMLHASNLGFTTSRTVYGTDTWQDVFVTNTICEFGIMATRPGNTAPVFPLYLYEGALVNDKSGGTKRTNFTNTFLKVLAAALQIQGKDVYGLPVGLTPEDIFHYIYAVFHSPTYRTRYAEFLKIDFPRIPLPGNLDLFRQLARLGAELVSLHLLESPKLNHFITEYKGRNNPTVQRVAWIDHTVWIDAPASKKGTPPAPGSNGFKGVPEDVWNFCIGGYQVCEKWLKDRKDRTLSAEDIAHYQKIVVALAETIRLMKEIDAVIDGHGGWPGAFHAEEPKDQKSSTPKQQTQASLFDAIPPKPAPFRPRIVKPEAKERYVNCLPFLPLKAAAGAFGDPQHLEGHSFEDFEWMKISTKRRLRPGMFVAQVVGQSMQPSIPDGAYCLFASPVEGSRQGKTVLVELLDSIDPETAQRYTVKRYESEKVPDGSSWRHEKIILKPINPAFQPIVLSDAVEGKLRVIAEMIEVLSGEG